MANFAYEAINAEGKLIKGSLEADNIDRARDSVKAQGLTVVSVGSRSAISKDLNFDLTKGPNVRDLSVFCRQFVSMIRAGVTILDSLQMLGESTENKKLREAIFDVRTSTETGMTLSGAMAEFPTIFPWAASAFRASALMTWAPSQRVTRPSPASAMWTC